MRRNITEGIFGAIEKLVVSGKIIFSRQSLIRKLQAMDSLCFEIENRALNRALGRMEKRKMIRHNLRGGEDFYKLTSEGMINLLGIRLRKKDLEKKKWDGKWRLILFDIPESKKFVREALRRKLKYFHFYPIQKSVFVYPYDCIQEINDLTEFFRAAEYVEILILDSLGRKEHEIRQFYSL